MSAQDYSFKANIRLKDLIGQGLINNSNIAIIELIKNARDANSPGVKVIFENANAQSDNSRIIIQDTGSGMNLDDIIHKWLNIAYSEKRDKGLFAGDKGIGRFSCDRLGKTLHLYTKRSDDKLVHLHVDWEKFEVDDRDKEISFVKLDPEYISQAHFEAETGLKPFQKGTCIIIEDLRERWGKNELERLQKELERFIIDPDKTFSVYFKSKDFTDKDGNFIFDGEIENKLFMKLDERTISVHTKITDNGKIIKTEIHHYGDVICSFEEDNPYSELKTIKAQVHYLSQGSKVSFKNITGYSSADYGSIMFFFNGFRVMPYGEPKDDWLQLNQRKAQGTRRYLGTRDLFGIVEASDDKRRFVPVTSREGMANTKAFRQLSDPDASDRDNAFIHEALRVLERYVVDGIDWDRVKPPEGKEVSVDDITKALKSVLEGHKKNKKLRNVEIDYKKITQIAEQKISEYEEFVEDLLERVSDKQVYDLTALEKQDVKKYIERHDAIITQKEKTNKDYKQKIIVETKRRMYAESNPKTDSVRFREITHHIENEAEEIYGQLVEALDQGRHRSEESFERVLEMIGSALFRVNKIQKLSRIVTKSNFDLMSDFHREDYFTGIKEYINEIIDVGATWGIDVSFENPDNVKLILNFSPLEQAMLVDNILDNAMTAKANNLTVRVIQDDKYYILEFIDDGDGLSEKYESADLFEAGISTTSGTGIGLNQIKKVTKNLGGEVSISNNITKGATLSIRWKK